LTSLTTFSQFDLHNIY